MPSAPRWTGGIQRIAGELVNLATAVDEAHALDEAREVAVEEARSVRAGRDRAGHRLRGDRSNDR